MLVCRECVAKYDDFIENQKPLYMQKRIQNRFRSKTKESKLENIRSICKKSHEDTHTFHFV